MNKSIALAAVFATLSAGTAFAQIPETTEPYGSQPVADVRAAGKGAIVGRMEHGELKTGQIVREDGSPAPRHGMREHAAREQGAQGHEARKHDAHRHGAQRHGADQQKKPDNAQRGPERHNRAR